MSTNISIRCATFFMSFFLINTHKTAMNSDKKSFKLLILLFILVTTTDILARNIVGK